MVVHCAQVDTAGHMETTPLPGMTPRTERPDPPAAIRWVESGRPKIHNFAHNTAPDDAIYCGRGSAYGNRHVVGRGISRDEACERFECEDLPTLDVEPLRGKDCTCFCVPKRCHVESIFRKLYGYVPDFYDFE